MRHARPAGQVVIGTRLRDSWRHGSTRSGRPADHPFGDRFQLSRIFTRLIHLDAWTVPFWRGLFAGLIILCVIVAQERPRTVAAIRAIGRPGLIVALCSTAATILYINALRHTSVADVAVIFATAPFIIAGLGWIWLGIKEPWATLIASLAVLLGVGIMVGGAAAEGRLVGDVLAIWM
jgi:drug/metabolite transporter (DMT)-like permease